MLSQQAPGQIPGRKRIFAVLGSYGTRLVAADQSIRSVEHNLENKIL